MASALKEMSGEYGQGAGGGEPSYEPEAARSHGVGDRPSLGEVSSLMVHGATHDDGGFGQPEITIPGQQLQPPDDPSAVTIKFIPEPPRLYPR